MLAHVDWLQVLRPDAPVLEILVRGTLTYVFILVLLRVVLRRQSGAVNIADLLVIVLIADAAQNAMAGSYDSVADGLVLVSTIVGCAWVVDWLGYHIPLVERLVHPPPLRIVRDGRLVWPNMRRELITREELMSQLREQGIESVEQVREAFVEGDGQISIVPYEQSGSPRRRERRQA
jgi:uncharacterized membrane protein YcaP (DUF421 family)